MWICRLREKEGDEKRKELRGGVGGFSFSKGGKGENENGGRRGGCDYYYV